MCALFYEEAAPIVTTQSSTTISRFRNGFDSTKSSSPRSGNQSDNQRICATGILHEKSQNDPHSFSRFLNMFGICSLIPTAMWLMFTSRCSEKNRCSFEKTSLHCCRNRLRLKGQFFRIAIKRKKNEITYPLEINCLYLFLFLVLLFWQPTWLSFILEAPIFRKEFDDASSIILSMFSIPLLWMHKAIWM